MFNYERKFFSLFKESYDEELKKDFLDGIKILLKQYNTTIYENRFVVGGAVEYFIYIILRKLGFPVNPSGDESKGGDIRFINGKHLSLKSSFTRTTSAIRMVNTMGAGRNPQWDTPTLFVIARKGIGYADPGLIDERYLKNQKDCLELKTKGLYDFWETNQKYFIIMDIPVKTETQLTGKSEKASNIIAQKIISDNRLFR